MADDPYSLHDAVQRCDEGTVTELIAAGVELVSLDELGMAPIHWAVYGGYKRLVRILLQAGADPNVRTRDGATALWYAEDDFGLTEIATILRDYEATK